MLDKIFFYFQTMVSRFIYFISPRNILKLKKQREILSRDVLDFVNQHIRDADPKYEQERILFQSETQKGEDESNILLRRNSRRKMKKELQDEVRNVIEFSS